MDNQSGRRYKILIVDDATDIAALYRRRLLRDGFEVAMAGDGDAGLALARQFHPDLILLDLMMPGLSGFDAIDLFRGILETSDARIVVLSALGGPADIEKAKNRGADDYIIKSKVSIAGVADCVKEILGMPTSSDSMGENGAASGGTGEGGAPTPAA
jgi:two-component system alkaline phosphatase synthesis response regulator PhoP